MIGKWLNDNLGGLIAAGVIAVVAQSIIGYAHALRTDDRLLNFERFAQQQQAINEANIKISEHVAVMATRVNYMERDIDRVFANMPATTGNSKN